MRHLAFKYQLKAANHAINHGAYNDGLVYTQAAEELVQRKVEYIVLIEVVNHAISDLTKLMPKSPFDKSLTTATLLTLATDSEDGADTVPPNDEYVDNGLLLKTPSTSPKLTLTPNKQASHLSNQYSRSFYCEHENDLRQKINAYQGIRINCENALAKLRLQEALVPQKTEGSGAVSGSNNGKGKKKDIRSLLMRKNTSHKLSWQLSTALPQGKYGSDKDKEKEKEKEKEKHKEKHKEKTAAASTGATSAVASGDGSVVIDDTAPVTVRSDSTRFDAEEDISPGSTTQQYGMQANNGCCVIS